MPCTKKMSKRQRSLYYATEGFTEWGGIRISKRRKK
jgi:hypothetical protein